MKMTKISHVALFFLGICCCGYWLILTLMYGSITFLPLFLIVGIFCISLGVLSHHFHISIVQFLPKWCYRSAFFLLLLFALLFCWIEVKIWSCAHHTDQRDGDIIIVLGAGLIDGDQISSTLQHRLEMAQALYEKNPNTWIIVSGGQGKDERISEAHAMRQWLIEHGINQQQILCEDQSANTSQNILNVKKLLHQMGKENVLISLVTSDFHMYRAKYLAEYHGLQIAAKPAPSLPFADACFYSREFFAVLRAWWLHY